MMMMMNSSLHDHDGHVSITGFTCSFENRTCKPSYTSRSYLVKLNRNADFR